VLQEQNIIESIDLYIVFVDDRVYTNYFMLAFPITKYMTSKIFHETIAHKVVVTIDF